MRFTQFVPRNESAIIRDIEEYLNAASTAALNLEQNQIEIPPELVVVSMNLFFEVLSLYRVPVNIVEIGGQPIIKCVTLEELADQADHYTKSFGDDETAKRMRELIIQKLAFEKRVPIEEIRNAFDRIQNEDKKEEN